VLSVAEAARAVLAKLPRLHVERVAIDDARGRVLADAVASVRATEKTKPGRARSCRT